MSVDVSSLLLTGARIVLPDRVAHADLFIDNGLIVKLVENDDRERYPADSVLNLTDTTILPGFIDVHIHGAAGVDTMDASAAQLSQVARLLATQGVTGWLPTLVPASRENYLRAISAIEQLHEEQRRPSPQIGARVLGAHYEGPFVNRAQCGALHGEHFQSYSDESQVDQLPVMRTGGVKMMMTLAPEIEGGVDLISLLRRRGWIISLGHTRATPDVLDRAHQAGGHHMTHFMNAMAPLHQRSPGPIGWGLSRGDVTCDIIADGVHLDPLILRLLLKIKGADSLCLISDAIAAAGMGEGEYQIWGETIAVTNGRTSNAAGSIAGSVITMLDAVRMMLSLGVSEVEVARMASTNPARLLRLNECGSIEEGKRADLIALDAAGKVRLTMIGGNIAFQA